MDRNFKILAWALAGVVFAMVGNDLWVNTPLHSWLAITTSLRMQVFVVYCIAAAAFWAWGWAAIVTGRDYLPANINRWVSRMASLPRAFRQFTAILVIIASSLGVYLLLGMLSLGGIGLAILILTAGAMLGYVIWSPPQPGSHFMQGYLKSLIFTFAVALVISRVLSASSYPFSLGWSEGNRLWDYSLMFGSGRYDFPAEENIFGLISPGRAIVWGLPFLFPSAGIYAARFWAQLINILPYTIFAYLLLDASGVERKSRWLFAAWGFLFLSQGPVYPHLIVAAIIMILGVRTRSIYLAAILVAASAFFAYYSRWSWVYAPGLWAGMLALMRADAPSLHRRDWPKLARPVVLGLSGFIGGQLLPIFIRIPSGTHPQTADAAGALNLSNKSAFTQELLWERLWPNATFGPGVILGLLIIVVPLVVWIALSKRSSAAQLNTLQKFGLAFPIFAFLVVGVIASTKIGGGGDLHNLDMFFVSMLILAAWFWRDVISWLQQSDHLGGRHFLVCFMLLAPLIYSLMYSYSPPLELPSKEQTSFSLVEIQAAVDQAKEQGEVLFLDQRQLLTFGFMPDVPLVDVYEKKVLIDFAMSGDQAYFDDFYSDLANQRFTLIISEPVNLRLSGGEGPFAEENDVWVEWVSTYLLRYYKVLKTYKSIGVQLLVPR